MSPEMPDRQSMDDYLDEIIPLVKPWGEDLYEKEYYLNKRWMEIRDRTDFHESVLHIFQEENQYLHTVDGNINKGVWKMLPESNTLILERHANGNAITSELFDLAFMNGDFFILRKHGDQKSKGQPKYFVMGREAVVRGLEWREVMELLFSRYRSSSQFTSLAIALLVIIAVIILFSLL